MGKFPVKRAKALLYAMPNIPMASKKLCAGMMDLFFSKSDVTRSQISDKLSEIGIKDGVIDDLTTHIIQGRSNGFSKALCIDIFKMLGLSEQAEGMLLSSLEALEVFVDESEPEGPEPVGVLAPSGINFTID